MCIHTGVGERVYVRMCVSYVKRAHARARCIQFLVALVQCYLKSPEGKKERLDDKQEFLAVANLLVFSFYYFDAIFILTSLPTP